MSANGTPIATVSVRSATTTRASKRSATSRPSSSANASAAKHAAASRSNNSINRPTQIGSKATRAHALAFRDGAQVAFQKMPEADKSALPHV